MTEIILETNTFPEAVQKLIKSRRVRLRDLGGEIRLTPVDVVVPEAVKSDAEFWAELTRLVKESAGEEICIENFKPRRQRAKISLEARFQGYTGDYKPSEHDWGKPVGGRSGNVST